MRCECGAKAVGDLPAIEILSRLFGMQMAGKDNGGGQSSCRLRYWEKIVLSLIRKLTSFIEPKL